MKTSSKSSFRAWNLNIKNDEKMKMDEKSSAIPFEEDLSGGIPCSPVASCTTHLPGLEQLFAPQGRRMVNWSHGNQEIPRSMGFYCESPWALLYYEGIMRVYNLNPTYLVVNLCASYHLDPFKVNSSCSSNWLPIVTGRWINDTTIAAPSTSDRPAWFVSVRSAVFSEARVA